MKYEEVYLKDHTRVGEAWEKVARGFGFYNQPRHLESLGLRTPPQVYFGTQEGSCSNSGKSTSCLRCVGAPQWP